MCICQFTFVTHINLCGLSVSGVLKMILLLFEKTINFQDKSVSYTYLFKFGVVPPLSNSSERGQLLSIFVVNPKLNFFTHLCIDFSI